MKHLHIFIFSSFILAQGTDTTKTDTSVSDTTILIQETDTTKTDTSVSDTTIFTQETDTTKTDTSVSDTTLFPEVKIEKKEADKLPEGKPFFDYKDNFEGLQIQIDSLKRVIRVIERKKAIPAINEELLNLIRIPELKHRVELTNGTIVIGEIIEETGSVVIIQTTIGQLAIEKDKVVNIEEEKPPAPKVELMSEPFVSVYPDHEEITGIVKNTGKTRADFVRIIASLWTAETELASRDSAFAQGSVQEYATGVITDTAIEPDATASFTITVLLSEGSSAVEYRTYNIHWSQME